LSWLASILIKDANTNAETIPSSLPETVECAVFLLYNYTINYPWASEPRNAGADGAIQDGRLSENMVP
jgi:hypothetical protein